MADRPVILIGAARSGTKFLRDIIVQDAAFSCVPYDVNYIWRMGNEQLPHDVLQAESVSQKTKVRIKKALYKLAGIKEGSKQRLIEKTVSNTLRVPFIESVLPNALYIHLVRDGHAVIESSYRLWQAPPNGGALKRKLMDLPISQYGYLCWFGLNYLKGLLKGRSGGVVWGPRYKGIMDDVVKEELLIVVARQWNECVLAASRDLEKINPSRVFTIRYEDIARNPEEVKKLSEFIDADAKSELTQKVNSSFESSNLEKWRDSLSGQQVDLIEAEAFEALNKFGYLNNDKP